jgi:hypothetical protein
MKTVRLVPKAKADPAPETEEEEPKDEKARRDPPPANVHPLFRKVGSWR